jgi:hypothetical protein
MATDSAIRLELDLSPSRPRTLGHVVAQQAHGARLLHELAHQARLLGLDLARRGKTSPFMKSSAVFFIIRCSSFSISGVKIVAEPVGSSRNPPPGESVIAGLPML